MSFQQQTGISGTRECPPPTGTYIIDKNLNQRYYCCTEDNLGFKHLVLTNSRDDCLAKFGSGGGSGGRPTTEECIPGIPISCGMLTVMAIGVVGAIGTMLAALYVRRR